MGGQIKHYELKNHKFMVHHGKNHGRKYWQLLGFFLNHEK